MYSAFMQYKEVLVTGGTGPLGRYVCPSLIGNGFLPRLFVRLGSAVGRVYEDASTDRFPWQELPQLSGHPPPSH
jgi:nucleoside-diphosphate-sugar epimerase